MYLHVTALAGHYDAFEPQVSKVEPKFTVKIDLPDDTVQGAANLCERFKKFGLALPEKAVDLLILAQAVYTADLRIQRQYSEDGWSREICLHLPVSDVPKWTEAQPQLVEMLGFLTGDTWEISFRERAARRVQELKLAAPEAEGVAMCLFSGGLDSLVGAIDLLTNARRAIFVGHYGPGVTHTAQVKLLDMLEKAVPGKISRYQFYVHPSKIAGEEGEPTMRSRSILFLSLGVAVREALGLDVPIVVAENGLISLNVPLMPSRTGSLSTRTTHPHFVSQFQSVLGTLGLKAEIALPYRFRTKGEMLQGCGNGQLLRQTATESISCSHSEALRYLKQSPGQHCGYCVPCIIRRAAFKHAAIGDRQYVFDVLTNPPKKGTVSAEDLVAFKIALQRYSENTLHDQLADVIGTGPLPSAEIKSYVDVYRRGMDEVCAFLNP